MKLWIEIERLYCSSPKLSMDWYRHPSPFWWGATLQCTLFKTTYLIIFVNDYKTYKKVMGLNRPAN